MSKFKVGDSVKKREGESETFLSSKNLQLAEDTSKYHKHHDLIIQWAKGAEIEYGDYQGDWENAATPTWSVYKEYRIKPTPPKTDKERIAELEARVKELEDNQ